MLWKQSAVSSSGGPVRELNGLINQSYSYAALCDYACYHQKIIPARDPKQWGGKGGETSGGDDDDDDTQMRAQRSRHMRAHESRHMRAHI